MSNVMILYVAEPETVLAHFRALGMEFKEEKHGVYGKIHWACEKDGRVLEIYPLDNDWPSNTARAGIRWFQS